MNALKPYASLREYKELNNYVTRWLVCSGKDRGCPDSLLKPAATNHYIINTSSFVPIAEWIEGAEPAAEVPKSILSCLDRVIDLRTRHGEERRGPGRPTAADRGHLHFIDVLQDLRTVLHRLPIAAAQSRSSPPAQGGAASNRFGVLDTPEVSDDTEQDDEEHGIFIPPVAWQETSVHIVDDTPTIEEGLFQFRLLLEDFRSLEATVTEQWDLYVAGKRDLAAVAVITNMASLLAKEMEKQARDFLREILEGQDDKRQATARGLANRLGISETAEASVLEGNPYFAFYFWLLRKPVDSSNEEEYQVEEQAYSNTFKVVSAWHTDVCFMPNASTNLLRIGEGQYGSHTYKGHWHELPVQERREKSRAFLLETLPELHFVGRLSKDKVPVQDHSSRGVYQSVEGGALELSTVFAMQILLYIRNKLFDAGKTSGPLQALQSFLRSATTSISSLTPILPDTQRREPLRPAYEHLLQIQDDMFKILKTGISTSGVVATTGIFTLRRSPVLCGLLLHAERILAQDTGQSSNPPLPGGPRLMDWKGGRLSDGPLKAINSFLRSTADKMSALCGELPTLESHALLDPTFRHMTELLDDMFNRLKAAKQGAGVTSVTPFFTLRRHPILCGLILHKERALAQEAALKLESRLGGLVAAVHLGNAFTGDFQSVEVRTSQLHRVARGDRESSKVPPSLIQPSQSTTTSNEYPLRLANFVPLATSIEGHQETILAPRKILADLDRAINLRTRFAPPVQDNLSRKCRQRPSALKTITVKITTDLQSPHATPSTRNLHPIVYCIVRGPSLPISKPSNVLAGILAEHLVELQAQQPAYRRLTDLVSADGAIFTQPVAGRDFVALRVVDPTSDTSHWDDSGRFWPGRWREVLWWGMLTRGEASNGPPTVNTWLMTLLGDPSPSSFESPWGICGVNYGTGEAKAYSKPTDHVDWSWP
ncbi:hypothetical protein C8A01DRAFT_40850 [Parachaetomium inaequale]|uniref:DUF6604 domain-containing protein n=1 Tax=Parachaetomium inaequale TaxID=2588326 RepID=A0AAN6P9C1_9PEZI|nr:hypothetical protein C8A01DRAFT_40850 [Parachaetomium inaequale]